MSSVHRGLYGGLMTLRHSGDHHDELVPQETALLVDVLIAVADLAPDCMLTTSDIDGLLGVTPGPVDEVARARLRRKARSGAHMQPPDDYR